jgi:RNA:NAD 2'-phosphotransferase (TPT1/KptA family)
VDHRVQTRHAEWQQQGLVPVSRSQVSLCSDEQVMARVRLVGFVLPTLSGDR